VLIDSHCHLDHLKLADYQDSLDGALEAARQAGVTGFLCIGIDYEKFDLLLEIESRHPDVWLTIGEHPLSDTFTHDPEKLMQYASHDRIVALGETGLDYHYAPEQAEKQKISFVHHLDAAAKLNKPIIVHSREAQQDTLDLIEAHCGPARGVLHCFTESWNMAQRALDLGFYISISGIVTFNNAEALRDVVKKIPLDRLLVETDSPWLAPVPFRGKSNQPLYLPKVASQVAETKGVSLDALAEATSENFFRLFSLACQKPALDMNK
jgi:TatD DNase family protein